MKFFFLLYFSCSVIFHHAQGPGFLWAKNMAGGGLGFSAGISITYDATGNVYTAGYFSGIVDFDPGPTSFTLASVPGGVSGNNDIFISKLDASGNFIWAKSVGGSGNDYCNTIALDASGSVFITGYYIGTSEFDPGPSTFSLTSSGGQDIFILKLDDSGNFVWAKSMGGVGDEDGSGIILDNLGNVYITGFFQLTSDFDPGVGIYNLNSFGSADIFVSKLDNAGNFVWAKSMGGMGIDFANSITVDGSGNTYCTGSFQGTADFDPGAIIYNLISQSGSYNVFILKIDASGNFVWAKGIGGASSTGASDITIDASNNVYTTGYFVGTADFDPSPSTFSLISSGGSDIFISKLDVNGNFVLAKSMGGSLNDNGISIDIDALGNIYTIGSFQGTSDFDPNAGVYNLTTSLGVNYFYISKLNTTGGFIWAGAVGGVNDDQGVCICLDPSGNIYATGDFRGIIDFDTDTGVFNLTSSTSTSAFVLKMAPCCAGFNELSQNTKSVSCYPNPNNGVFNLNIENEIENGELVLFNTLGQVVYEQKISQGANQINTNELAKGLYNCRLINNKQKIEVGKLAIE